MACDMQVHMSPRSRPRPPQQVIQTAHPEPAIAVRLHQDAVHPRAVRLAVRVRQQVDQQAVVQAACPGLEPHLKRNGGQVVHEQHGVAAPLVAERQDLLRAGLDGGEGLRGRASV